MLPESISTPVTRVIALTPKGLQLAERIKSHFPDFDIWFKTQPFGEKVQQAFSSGERLIFICATGIVVRTLAPVLQDKYQDPPVLVLDEQGQFVIPLLSGHEGGANDWAAELSQTLSAKLILTTAQSYLKPKYTVGMGCERNCPLSYLEELLFNSLQQSDLTIEQIDSFHSINVKVDETHLIALAEKYRKPFLTWQAEELRQVEAQLSVRSDYVFNTVGVYGVAESAALYGAQNLTKKQAELVLAKQKNSKATCAIARSYSD